MPLAGYLGLFFAGAPKGRPGGSFFATVARLLPDHGRVKYGVGSVITEYRNCPNIRGLAAQLSSGYPSPRGLQGRSPTGDPGSARS